MAQHPLARWLGSLPGAFYGKTHDESLEKAHTAYAGAGGTLEFDEFKVKLNSAGHTVQCRNDHDTGAYLFVLPLPGRGPGVWPEA